MHTSNNRGRASAEDLKCRYALRATIEDGLADELGEMAARLKRQGHLEQAQQFLDTSRRHRVGAVKYRALMSALEVEQG
ncbi:hypothetical protein [Methylobacterium nigriterrae]|uniref:hypothetical protein n=1 Tax=Methylobacterium nigriterrae TaxID=3127512 RepID=UPI0030138AFC